MRNAVRFKSSKFNTTEVKDYFYNDTGFGDDVADLLSDTLSERGFKANAAWQEDWGWQFETESCLVSVGFDGEEWQIYLEPIRGFFQKLFGQETDISGLTEALHRILIDEPEIYEIRWFRSDKTGQETDFASEP